MEKSNGNNSNNSKWKSKSNIYRKDKRKLPPNSSGNDNRQSWSHDGNSTERHKGSYNIDLIKDSEEYQRRIVQVGSVKRKYAVCFGYLGSAYQGLQINPDTKTVEAELEKALLLSGGIQECNFGFFHKVQWSRSARTDRGVHAVSQCCAMKLEIPMDKKDEYVQQINQFLPTDIRVHGLTKVSKNFNAKNQCTKRRYNYLLPTYMLNDRKNMQYILQTLFLEQGPVVGAGYGGGYADPSSDKFLTTEYLAKARGSMISYRIDGNKLELLKDTLQCFLGTHYFHNYTVNQKPTDATSQRFIDKFECHEPFVKDGVEWILLSLTGQSFLYNQIRKMVGMIVEVCRGNASKKTIDLTFSNHKVEVPLAPGLGLYLDELFFHGYNVKQQRENERDSNRAKKTEEEKLETAEVALNSNEDVVRNEEEPADKKQRIDDEDAKDDDPDTQTREVLDWYAVPEMKQSMDHFRNTIIHNHVQEEDAKDCTFLYFLDYLRVCSFSYQSKIFA